MKPIPIAIAVVCRGGEVLIGRRPAGVPLAGLWEFPGGKLLRGESPAEAAERECREETGVDVRVREPCLVVTHQYGHGLVQLHFFNAELVGPRQKPNERFRWVSMSELSKYDFPPANEVVVDMLQTGGWGAGKTEQGP